MVDQSPNSPTCIKVCKLGSQASSSRQPLVITHCLTITDQLQWSLFVHNHKVNPSMCSALAGIPNLLTTESLAILLNRADKLNICAGHPDSHFVSMVEEKKGVLKTRGGQPASALDDYAPVVLNGESFSQTVRTTKCEMLVNGLKCETCKVYRAYLRKSYAHWSQRCCEELTDVSSHTNIQYIVTLQRRNPK